MIHDYMAFCTLNSITIRAKTSISLINKKPNKFANFWLFEKSANSHIFLEKSNDIVVIKLFP